MNLQAIQIVKMNKKLLNTLFQKSTLQVARGLIGCRLLSRINGKECSGMIVETEAYDGEIDQACHCFSKRTPRNSIMFEAAGYCYVYFIYGMHYCVNVVTGKKGRGAAVLIRALEPLSGLDLMAQRRGHSKIRELCNGPAKLCEALAIDKKVLGEHFLSSKLIRIVPYLSFPERQIIHAKRIGISRAQDLEWRFFLKDNLFISKAK